jgi:ribosome-associated protein
LFGAALPAKIEHDVPHRTAALGPTGPSAKEVSLNARDLALAIAHAALDKQAQSIDIIDVSEKVDYTIYIVICSGRSERQVDAIASGVETALKKLKQFPLGVEGRETNCWVLMDYGDVVFHVFEDRTRGFYDLDGLWIDAVRVPIREAAGAG